MEQIHATFVKPMSQNPHTQAASGRTNLFSDASDNLPDRSKILLHVEVPLGDVSRNSSPIDKETRAFLGTNRRPLPQWDSSG